MAPRQHEQRLSAFFREPVLAGKDSHYPHVSIPNQIRFDFEFFDGSAAT
jgi:hypothetical protein